MSETMSISVVDWVVIGGYLAAMVAFGLWLARKTSSGEDYYLAGRNVPPMIAAMSIMATQTSTNSLIGAPAFVALKADGGMRWLQQEIALPLAMIAIMVLFVPLLWRSNVVTVYEFLERRFGVGVRLLLSGLFQISRALATGVTIKATAEILEVATGASIWVLIAIIAIVCLFYSTLGGLVADVYTDAVQLVVLWGSVFVSIGYAVMRLGSWDPLFSLPPERGQALIFSAHGFGDGSTFGFFPMLIGGFFLYFAYYGTDQTQAQRLLAAPSVSDARKSLLINGLLRYPLVVSYSLFGVALYAMLQHDPQFAAAMQGRRINHLVPVFVVNYLPQGIIGVIIAGMIAATMSSLDSTFNSLSAASMRDFVERFGWVTDQSSRRYVFTARAITFAWGIICSAFAFLFLDSSETVIELINKVGSLFYGPILGVFVVGFVNRTIGGKAVTVGMLLGVLLNAVLWKAPAMSGGAFADISWWWWNLLSFLFTTIVAVVVGMSDIKRAVPIDLGIEERVDGESSGKDGLRYVVLFATTVLIALSAWALGRGLTATPKH